MTSKHEIVIIGCGPIGLSAAASNLREDHKTVLFDSRKYRNAEYKHMHTVPIWDYQDPANFRAAARKDFERYGSIVIKNVKVKNLTHPEDEPFEATANGKTWTGKKVILATGVEDVFLDILGYVDCWVAGM
jgi:thioredoxin reductase